MKQTTMKRMEFLRAATFTTLLFLTALGIMCYAFTQNRNLIIGTEYNSATNVEYICFGHECENLNRFTWSD